MPKFDQIFYLELDDFNEPRVSAALKEECYDQASKDLDTLIRGGADHTGFYITRPLPSAKLNYGYFSSKKEAKKALTLVVKAEIEKYKVFVKEVIAQGVETNSIHRMIDVISQRIKVRSPLHYKIKNETIRNVIFHKNPKLKAVYNAEAKARKSGQDKAIYSIKG